jgi:hypothetical protein
MIQKSIPILILFLLTMAATAMAQSTRNPDQQQSFESNVKVSKKKKRSKKKGRYAYQIDNAVEEYEALMKQNAKKYAKMQKDMKKPQYSDPTYFGHKRKPKKRPLHKRKMCKECGIVH